VAPETNWRPNETPPAPACVLFGSTVASERTSGGPFCREHPAAAQTAVGQVQSGDQVPREPGYNKTGG
jgi:hypothetical protein